MDVNVTGLDRTLQNLMRLNIDEATENKALNKAGKITQEAIISQANFGKRSRPMLKNNIKLKRPKDGEVIIHTGKGYHAHLLEFGRSGGSKVGGGRKVTWGPMSPNPFFSRGFEQSVAESKQAMIEELQRELGL